MNAAGTKVSRIFINRPFTKNTKLCLKKEGSGWAYLNSLD